MGRANDALLYGVLMAAMVALIILAPVWALKRMMQPSPEAYTWSAAKHPRPLSDKHAIPDGE